MNKTLVIYGPTASGKTALAIKLAPKFQGELISADSRQIYKGLDIGTGKVSFTSKVEKHEGYWIVDGIKIHGFDLVKPGDNFSVADFLKFASDTLIRIRVSEKLPIVVGGTGFYVRSLIEGIDTIGIPANPKLRRQLEKLSTDQLYQKLTNIDKHRAKSMNQSDRANPRRLIRAIEVAMATNSVLSYVSSKKRSYRFVSLRSRMTKEVQFIGLTAPNEYLYKKADRWLITRLEKGMIEEVQNLLDHKISSSWLDSLGLEYRWVTRYLLGQITKEEMVNRLKGAIHNFIRRQKTWFKKFDNIKVFDITKKDWQKKVEKEVTEFANTI